MEKIRQREIARYLGVSEPFLSEIKLNRKGFSKHKAKELSELTGIDFEDFMLADGAVIYRKLLFAYSQQHGQTRPNHSRA